MSGRMAAFRRWLRTEQAVVTVLAVIVGVAVGYGVFGFLALIDLVSMLLYGATERDMTDVVSGLPRWRVFATLIVGGLVIGLVVHRFMPRRRNRGVAEVIETCGVGSARIDARPGMLAAAVSAASIGAGASVGREGPAIHLGATLSSWACARIGLSRSLSRTLLGCGAAAAVAASFNAPIAGVFFALEVVVGSYALPAFTSVVLASVAATVVTRIQLGDSPAFFVPTHDIVSFFELPAFVLLGLACAIASVALIAGTGAVQGALDRLRLPGWLRPALAGAAIAAIAVPFPEVLGVGYQPTDLALNQQLPLLALVLLAGAKVAATCIALGGGFAGGVFSPALFVGAMAGGAFGLVAGSIAPSLASDHGAYAVMGMAGVAAAALGAPISTILIVFELTGSYELTIAVMIVASVASIVAQALGGHRSFFHWQLAQRGVVIPDDRADQLMASTTIVDIVRSDFETTGPESRLSALREQWVERRPAVYFVLDGEGRLVAYLPASELLRRTPGEGEGGDVRVGEIARPVDGALVSHTSLDAAVATLRASAAEYLPVRADGDGAAVIGFVDERQLLAAHNRVLEEARRG